MRTFSNRTFGVKRTREPLPLPVKPFQLDLTWGAVASLVAGLLAFICTQNTDWLIGSGCVLNGFIISKLLKGK